MVVTGVGLVTPVGHDSVSAPAAIRAGISRFGTIPQFTTTSGAGATGAMVSGLAGGGSGVSRLLALAAPAAQEALFTAEEFCEDLDLTRSRLLLCLGPQDRPALDEFGTEDMQELLETIEAGPLAGGAEIVRDGHAGGGLALQRALDLLQDEAVDSCVIGGVDSLLDFPILNWLNDHGRLKTDENPEGLMPGEAAAFLVLERESGRRARGASALAEVVAPAYATEEAHLFSGKPLQGAGLTATLAETMSGIGTAVDGILCDLNGEYHRAKEWSLALTRVFASVPTVPESWYPAQFIGDVGAASVPVFAAVAVAAIRHGYFAGRDLLLWASSDAGGRASVLLRPVGREGARS